MNTERLPKITCPHCRQGRSLVVDSRPHPYRDGVWRRRRCDHCHDEFETLEQVVPPLTDPRLLRNVNT